MGDGYTQSVRYIVFISPSSWLCMYLYACVFYKCVCIRVFSLEFSSGKGHFWSIFLALLWYIVAIFFYMWIIPSIELFKYSKTSSIMVSTKYCDVVWFDEYDSFITILKSVFLPIYGEFYLDPNQMLHEIKVWWTEPWSRTLGLKEG